MENERTTAITCQGRGCAQHEIKCEQINMRQHVCPICDKVYEATNEWSRLFSWTIANLQVLQVNGGYKTTEERDTNEEFKTFLDEHSEMIADDVQELNFS